MSLQDEEVVVDLGRRQQARLRAVRARPHLQGEREVSGSILDLCVQVFAMVMQVKKKETTAKLLPRDLKFFEIFNFIKLADISMAQNNEVGDGTTQLLREAEKLIDQVRARGIVV